MHSMCAGGWAMPVVGVARHEDEARLLRCPEQSRMHALTSDAHGHACRWNMHATCVHPSIHACACPRTAAPTPLMAPCMLAREPRPARRGAAGSPQACHVTSRALRCRMAVISWPWSFPQHHLPPLRPLSSGPAGTVKGGAAAGTGAAAAGRHGRLHGCAGEPASVLYCTGG